MSLNAEFYFIEKSALNRLRPREDRDISVETIIGEIGKPLAIYESSGYYILILLLFLAEKEKIDIMSTEYNDISRFISESLRTICYLFTSNHKQKYEETLKSSKYSEIELREYYESFNFTEEEAGKSMIDGIEISKSKLEKLTPDTVIILRIT